MSPSSSTHSVHQASSSIVLGIPASLRFVAGGACGDSIAALRAAPPPGLLHCCPLFGTEFHYLDIPYQPPSRSWSEESPPPPHHVRRSREAAEYRSEKKPCRRRSPRRSGTSTSCTARTRSRICSISTSTWCTRSRARKRSTHSAWPGVACDDRTSPSRRWI